MTGQPPTGGDPAPGLETLGAEAYESRGASSTCGHDECNIPGKTDAETAWEELMAPIPDADVAFRVPAEANKYYYPDESTFEHVMGAVRPEGSDDHAMGRISESWKHVSDTQLQAIHDDLDSAIKTLSNSWQGEDFDSLSDTMDETLTMIVSTQDKIGDLTSELDETIQTVRNRQGLTGGETPFPPAQIYVKEADCCDGYKVHIRPPWGVECERLQGSEQIADALAEEGGVVVEEVRGWIDERVTDLVENDNMPRDEAERQAREEAQHEIDGGYSDELQAYVDQTNSEIEDIMGRRDEADRSVETMSLGNQAETPPEIANEEEIDPSPGPGAPPAGGAPSIPGGMDGFNSNTSPSPPSMPDMGGPNGPSSPSSPGLPGYDPNNPSSPGSPGLDDDNPWGSGIDDPDDIGGGLAGGGTGVGGPPGIGTGGGGPGGLGTGGGAGGGVGAGGMGMMGAGGAGAGRGAGAAGGRGGGRGAGGGMRGGAGAGAGGRGAGGRGMTGMMGGGGARPGMGAGEGEGGDDTWLTEDDDVWGIGNEDDDPYA